MLKKKPEFYVCIKRRLCLMRVIGRKKITKKEF